MYTVTVRDHMLIAHSLKGEVFGPAQGLHGATYVVSVTFARPSLGPDGIVCDIGRAIDALKAVVAEFSYRNLDEVPALAGVNTTTEVLAKLIFDRMAAAIRAGRLGPGSDGIARMTVSLDESPAAAAAYQGSLEDAGTDAGIGPATGQ
jgi:6-pyruvoyl-tetrahydropterin synthase